MEEKMRFVLEAKAGLESMTELCRRFGISRHTGYKWLWRYEKEGPSGLEDRSSRPRTSPSATPLWKEELILAVRHSYPNWGPKKIRAHLLTLNPEESIPTSSTIGRILKHHGLVRGRRRRRKMPRYSEPFAGCQSPNDVWAADFKGHFKTGRVTCYPLTISDGYSRFLLRCEGLRQTSFAHVQRTFVSAFREYGLPKSIRTDNGPPFATTGPGGLSDLSVWWVKLGIRPERIAPGRPDQNGRHERMHRTLKEDTAEPPADSFAEQQRAFNRFRQIYNETRPHEALGQRAPVLFYHHSEHRFPNPLPELEYADAYERYRADNDGTISLRGWTLRLAPCLRREVIGVLDEGSHFSIHFGPVLLGYAEKPARKTENMRLLSKRR
jgi:putative transposase